MIRIDEMTLIETKSKPRASGDDPEWPVSDDAESA